MAIEVAKRATGDLSRTGLELKLLGEAWNRRSDGSRFVRSLATFLGSKPNRGTQRVYGFAITEFFAWYKSMRGAYPLPSEVRREDAALYVKWLQERSLGVDELRLEQDPERLLDLVAYRYIKANPETKISAIRRELLRDSRLATIVEFTVNGRPQTARVLQIEANEPRGDDLERFREANGMDPESALDIRLACLCQHNLLRRSPSIVEIRERIVDLGLANPEQAQIGYRVDPEGFSYWANEYTENRGGDRAGTIVTKLSALSSYWSYLVKSTGENAPGADALLRYNIWRELVGAVRPTALNRAQAHREESVPDRDIFLRVLSATFQKSHGSDAMRAASAFLEGAGVRSSEVGEPSRYDLRDRAVLMFMFWTGVRAEELGSIIRSDLNEKTGIVSVTGKGDKRRSFRVPDAALRAIYEFQANLWDIPESKLTDLQDAIRSSEAPLFPPLKLWGRAQSGNVEEISGLTPSAIARMLHERAEQAGIERGSDDWYKVHPHGLRHLAALEAKRRGVDVATIQATLGHASLAHTGIYLEVRDPMERSLEPLAPTARPMPSPVMEARAEVRPTSKRPETKKPKTAKPVSTKVAVEPETEFQPTPIQTEETTSVVTRPEEFLEELLEPVDIERLGDAEDEAIDYLFEVYRENWGEEAAGKEPARRTSILAGTLESGLVEESQFARGALTHAYAGKRSSLPWWTGTTGEFKGEFSYTPNSGFPAMPIPSPAQFAPSEQGVADLIERLARIADEWLDDGSDTYRGPTAIGAMLEWLTVADAVSETATAVLLEIRKGEWIPFVSPLVETEVPPTALREHDLGAIEAWFRATAWQWRPRQGRIGEGTDYDPPAWYAEVDPLASLTDNERKELLDLLRVLVGRAPTDGTKRFGDQSRKSVGQFIGMMCNFERTLAEEIAGKRTVSKAQRKALAEANESIKLVLQGLVRAAAPEIRERAEKFDYAAEKQKRPVEASEDEDESPEDEVAEKGKALSKFFLEVTLKFFGKEAASDPLLKLYAMCSQGAPLAGYRDFEELFRIDEKAQTIVHESDFKRRFAEKHGQHSECLARRIARHLWEGGKIEAKQARKRWKSDEDLNRLLEYRTPCPRSQEAELQSLNPELSRKAVVDMARRMNEADGIEPPASDEDWRRKLVGGEQAVEGAGRVLPNPVRIRFAANAIRRAFE